MAPLGALAGTDGSRADGSGADKRILVSARAGDDAGVLRHGDGALVGTVDFITPVCDDPLRFGRIAAANSLSDVYAMGGRPLFALNLCCFPEKAPQDALAEILRGGAESIAAAGAVLLGGHTVADKELKYGLAVVGEADPERLLTHAGARAGERLILTKPLGTGVLINAFKQDKLDAAGLEPALAQMERLNDTAAQVALTHGASFATDITGFGLVNHLLAGARSSSVAMRVSMSALPTHEAFADLVRAGVSTGSTKANRANAADAFRNEAALESAQSELLFDPQTSGGLVFGVAADRVRDALAALQASGHTAAEIGTVEAGDPRVTVVP